MGSKRRYTPIRDTEKVYHDHFDNLRIKSKVLNRRTTSPSFQSISLSTKQSLTHELKRLTGDEEGLYRNEDGQYMAVIPALQQQIRIIEKRWKRHKLNTTNAGRPCPESMPPRMEKELYTTQAAIDVAEEEQEVLEKQLSKLEEVEDTARNKRMLKSGVCGVGRLRNGILCELDGQKITRMDDILVIDEPESKYHGMATTDYFEMLDVAAKESHEHYREQMKQYKAGKLAKRPPVHPKKMPPWPKDAKNYLEKETK